MIAMQDKMRILGTAIATSVLAACLAQPTAAKSRLTDLADRFRGRLSQTAWNRLERNPDPLR